MNTILTRILVTIGTVTVIALTGYWYGYSAGAAKWEKKYDGLVESNEKAIAASVVKQAGATAVVVPELKQMEGKLNDAYAEIDRLRKQRGNGGVTCSSATAGEPVAPVFSVAAVGLYNAAVSGDPALADPEGTAGEAGQAADSGFQWIDIVGNTADNAKSCAADRIRYEKLIDWLEQAGAIKKE